MADRYSSEIVAVVTALEWDSQPVSTVLRVALFGGMYYRPDDPSAPPTHYRGNIKSDILFKKQIGIEFWKDESAIDFGYLDLALEDQADELIDFGRQVMVARVEFFRVNLSNPAADQLEPLAIARTSDIGFDNEFTLRLRLESILQDGFDAAINERFYGYEYPQLTGKPYPIAWGLITDPYQVLPALEVDGTTLLYHITDLEIDSFETFVYDRGIPLSEPGEFNATTYGFTLNQNPDGRITAGRVLLNDPEETGQHLHGLFRFVRLGMTRAGIWNYAVQSEVTQLETDIGFGELFPQFFTDKTVSLEDFLKKILSGVTGWYYVDELTNVHFGRMTDPADASILYAFNDSNMVGRIKVEDDKAPGLTTRLSYAYSPGAYDEDEIAGGVYGYDRVDLVNEELVVSSDGYFRTLGWTADSGAFTADSGVITADGFLSEEFVEPTDQTYWSKVEVRVPIDLPIAYSESPSSFDLAEGEVTRWWSELYYKRRRFYTFNVKLNDEQFNLLLPQLGDFCSLQSDRFKLINEPIQLFIRRLEFNFSKNILTIEGWG
jgi:hypothetical protein